MPKRALRGNSYDADVVGAYVQRVEQLNEHIADELKRAKDEVRIIRDDIKQVYEEAVSVGIPQRPLRTIIRQRELERKMERAIATLDIDERSNYELLRDALGAFSDLPLGQAALERAQT